MTSVEWKIVVLGGGGVGKSAFTIQYIHNKFVDRYDPTIEDLYRKLVEFDGKQYMVEVLDTAGQETFMSMRDLYLRSGNAFLLMYAITSNNSFSEIQSLPQQIRVIKESHLVPIVVCANKSDLEKDREVSHQQGEEWTKEVKCPFFSTSAKDRTNVDEAFLKLVKMLDYQKTNPGKGSLSATSPSSGRSKKKGCLIL
eukprot:TRINITY_DN620_c0_g1_i1.p1 TRINITY_DN620_c0_g1~~TRINITY_DN620_c0_g1_i1.p1  ORF type:complete len:197 (-),score=70.27 TRINITY_DN620_c0_g1_i1:200-790(-)